MKRTGLIVIGVLILLASVMAMGAGGRCSASDSGSSAAPAAQGASWKTPALLETNNLGDVSDPEIAVDGSGNAIVIWPQSNAFTTHIYANNYIVGSGWAITNTLIETESTYSVYNARLAMNNNGFAIALWLQTDGTRNNLWANLCITGTTWGTATLLETAPETIYGYPKPQIAINDSGNAVAVWVQNDGTCDSLWANRYISGTGWTGRELVETNNTYDATAPQVAIDNSNNIIAVWVQDSLTGNHVYTNRYISGTGWAGVTPITNLINIATDPQIAMNDSGNAVVVWAMTSTDYALYANRYVSPTGWTSVSGDLIETMDGSASVPQIAMNNSGNAIVVFNHYVLASCKAYATRYISPTGWTTVQLICNGQETTTEPRIAINDSGNAMAIWYQYDTLRTNIWANRYIAGTGWVGSTSIETNANDADGHKIVIDNSCNSIAVWKQSDSTKVSLWANRFE
ncbi:MAG: hypothetical protein V1871_06755 [Planctomycetota bacterium]